MSINFKSLLLCISAFLINVQFIAPIDPVITEDTYYSEPVADFVELSKQENVIIPANLIHTNLILTNVMLGELFSESTQPESLYHFSVNKLIFNQNQVSRKQYQTQQQVAYRLQSFTQLDISISEYLFHTYQQSMSDEIKTTALTLLS